METNLQTALNFQTMIEASVNTLALLHSDPTYWAGSFGVGLRRDIPLSVLQYEAEKVLQKNWTLGVNTIVLAQDGSVLRYTIT